MFMFLYPSVSALGVHVVSFFFCVCVFTLALCPSQANNKTLPIRLRFYALYKCTLDLD